ncbi:MAG TPA: hypothetical protein VNW94_27430 [Streptosporangiaceae bacterium]|nr:hypothetical protein [Streptosporangiaceae bacterium]
MITAALARRAWNRLEPVHGMIYFVPEAFEAYQGLGLDATAGYFASRSAALGRVPAETVIACFYNFCPDLVRAAIPAAWDLTTPEALLAARLDAADRALRRGLGESLETSGIAEAAELARRAAESACDHLEGRALFAAHAALSWPDQPHLVLWHAQTLLREFRGDGHLAALLIEGLTGLEALILHGASGEAPMSFLRRTRGWPDEIWEAAVDRLRSTGLLTGDADLTLSAAGSELRQRIEERTDTASLPAYGALGQADAERLCALAAPITGAILDAGLLPVRRRADPRDRT